MAASLTRNWISPPAPIAKPNPMLAEKSPLARLEPCIPSRLSTNSPPSASLISSSSGVVPGAIAQLPAPGKGAEAYPERRPRPGATSSRAAKRRSATTLRKTPCSTIGKAKAATPSSSKGAPARPASGRLSSSIESIGLSTCSPVRPASGGGWPRWGGGKKGPARTAGAGGGPGAVADPTGSPRPAGAGARQQSVRQRLQPVDRLAAHLDQLADADRLHLPVADVGVDRAAGRQAERPLLDLGQAGGLERGLDGVLDAVQDRGRGEADPATREHADPDASAGTAVDAGQPVVLVVHGVARRL